VDEATWLGATDPQAMLDYLHGRAGERKLRLFACACCRRVWHLMPHRWSRRAVEVVERYTDEEAGEEDLRLAAIGAETVADDAFRTAITPAQEAAASAAFAALNATLPAEMAAAYSAANAVSAAYHAATAAHAPSAAEARAAERAGQARLLRDLFGNPFRPVVVNPHWVSAEAHRLARVIYRERAFDWLPVLGDALEEAGCTEDVLLRHCRSGGEHAPGCWALDLILGTS
jgi:hypothetical protein